MAELTLVDTHCHLDAAQFAGEPVAALVERAAAAGVTRLVTIGTDLNTSAAAVELAEAHDNVWATVGVDPNDCAEFDDAALATLAALAKHPKVVGIGEIGLDYYWNKVPHEVQQCAFEAQLALADRLGLPVVIHSRDALDDTESVLVRWASERVPNDRPPGVMHCYSGDLARAHRLVAAGFLVSLAGIVTYKNAQLTQEVAAGLPAGALVLETDAPYLAPHPHRGARNEPAYVRPIAEHVAGLRGETLEAVAAATSANAARLFGWMEP